jgi:hypothetical protein
MTREELIQKLARAIAEKEGFFVTEAQAKARKIPYPMRAGNIRAWRDAKGRPYPISGGYVDFAAWAAERYPGVSREEMSRRALEEGRRTLRVLVGQYLDGGQTCNTDGTKSIEARTRDRSKTGLEVGFCA